MVYAYICTACEHPLSRHLAKRSDMNVHRCQSCPCEVGVGAPGYGLSQADYERRFNEYGRPREDTSIMTEQDALAVERIRAFTEAYPQHRGIDPEVIYGLDGGIDVAGGTSLLLSDLTTLLTLVQRLIGERDEARGNQIVTEAQVFGWADMHRKMEAKAAERDVEIVDLRERCARWEKVHDYAVTQRDEACAALAAEDEAHEALRERVRKIASELHAQGWNTGPKYASRLRALLDTDKTMSDDIKRDDEWRIVTATDLGPWPCTIIDRNGRSLLSVVNGTPVIRSRDLAEVVLTALNTTTKESDDDDA